MAGKVLNLYDVITRDALGSDIGRKFHEWDILRQNKKTDWSELRKYIYATDTRTTTNSKLPWKNTTTVPKLTQIRDNLAANYTAALFPKRKWLYWDASDKDSAQQAKRDAITGYMKHTTYQSRFKTEFNKLIFDFIDYGNAFATVEWVDERQEVPSGSGNVKVGYCGPSPLRISPLDIVFNPTAPSFTESPKIVRSVLSMGEIKKLLNSMTTDANRQAYADLFKYLRDVRITVRNAGSELTVQDEYFRVDGFTSFRAYLESDYVEILTFYGDIYDFQTETFWENRKIMVADRHKIISNEPNPSYFGYPPIFHVGWRPRQDNLWAMGPLDNLVGMQYRVDHVENLKADVLDLIGFPVLKIKGYVEPFTWQPMEKISVSDEGDVEMLAPPFQILQMNSEIQNYMNLMEESAGSPKEAMGFRTPGEKTAYEVQRLENAAARIFLNKILQFEDFEEWVLNAMLELARRNVDETQTISVFDDTFNYQVFHTLTPQDITGGGRIKPIAARHFAEKAEMVQNLNNFANSAIGQDPAVSVHISGLGIAKIFEDLLDLKDFNIVQPFVRIAEQADAQRLSQAAQEQTQMEAQTASGLTPDDHDLGPGRDPGAPASQPLPAGGNFPGQAGAPGPLEPQVHPVPAGLHQGRVGRLFETGTGA